MISVIALVTAWLVLLTTVSPPLAARLPALREARLECDIPFLFTPDFERALD